MSELVRAAVQTGPRQIELREFPPPVTGPDDVDARAYGEAIRLIESGRFPLERMHTHTFELADTADAIQTLAGEIPGEEAVHVAIAPDAMRSST